MKKLSILLPLLLFNFSFIISAQTIKKIELKGNENVSEQKILSLIQTMPGMEYRSDVLDNDLKKLGETGFFKSFQYQTETTDEGIIIKLFFVENPLISDIKFKGNKAFKSKKLNELLGIKKGDIFSEIDFKEALEGIKEKYIEKGFSLVTLKVEAIEEENRVSVVILINEGTKLYTRKISLQGNTFLSSSKIKKSFKIKERSTPFIRGTFKDTLFAKDIQLLQNIYLNSGFLDVKISDAIIPHEKGGIIVKIDIEEGEQYFLGDIKIEGNILVEKEKLINLLELKTKGSPLNQSLLGQNRKKLMDFYTNQGYIKARIEEIPLLTAQPNIVDITYLIKPGKIHTAGEIKISGNTKTKDKVIRREIKIEPSDVIATSLVQKSFNNLNDLNYFEMINIYPEFTEQEDIANIVVDVAERDKTGIFLIGGGYSSVDNVIGMISVQQSNFDISNPWSFQGGGQDLQLSFEFGTEAKNYRLSFTEPYFLDKPIWAGFDIYGTKREWRDYTEERKGFALRAGKKWENVSLGFNLKTESIDLYDINDARIPSIVPQEGENRKNSITATLTHSSLDRRRAPSTGNLAKFSIESAGGPLQGDINFIKSILENDFYYPIKNFTFRSRTYAGFIEETKKAEVIPIYERFFGGGIGTVRGYKERSIGPKDEITNEPVGGKALFAQNFELVYPIHKDTLKGVFFCDIGNIWDSFGDFSDLRKGAGAGIRFIVPILNAPIEIYYGLALDKKPSDANGRWHIGMSFGF